MFRLPTKSRRSKMNRPTANRQLIPHQKRRTKKAQILLKAVVKCTNHGPPSLPAQITPFYPPTPATKSSSDFIVPGVTRVKLAGFVRTNPSDPSVQPNLVVQRPAVHRSKFTHKVKRLINVLVNKNCTSWPDVGAILSLRLPIERAKDGADDGQPAITSS